MKLHFIVFPVEYCQPKVIYMEILLSLTHEHLTSVTRLLDGHISLYQVEIVHTFGIKVVSLYIVL